MTGYHDLEPIYVSAWLRHQLDRYQTSNRRLAEMTRIKMPRLQFLIEGCGHATVAEVELIIAATGDRPPRAYIPGETAGEIIRETEERLAALMGLPASTARLSLAISYDPHKSNEGDEERPEDPAAEKDQSA